MKKIKLIRSKLDYFYSEDSESAEGNKILLILPVVSERLVGLVADIVVKGSTSDESENSNNKKK